MCGHFEARLYLHLLRAHTVDAAQGPNIVESRRVAPSLPAPILLHDPQTRVTGVAEARFGLVPFWYRGLMRDWKASTFNARLEDAAVKPAFKGPWRYRRCVAPADAFNEWSGPKSDRRKWRITRADNQPMAFAGLWDEATCADGDVLSFCILTRPAGEDMRGIHDREPVVLPPDQWEGWMRAGDADLHAPTPLRITPDSPPPGGTLPLL